MMRSFAGGSLRVRCTHLISPLMLECFQKRLRAVEITVELAQADVLRLNELPTGWTEFDLLVTASMLEYVPRDQFASALAVSAPFCAMMVDWSCS